MQESTPWNLHDVLKAWPRGGGPQGYSYRPLSKQGAPRTAINRRSEGILRLSMILSENRFPLFGIML
jgi:hypothetical protein